VELATKNLVVWYYDSGSSRGYVVLGTSDKETVAAVRGHLEIAGIHCDKEGNCVRPANNGRMYKVFLRVVKATGSRPQLTEVRKALRTLRNGHFDADPGTIRTFFNSLIAKTESLKGENAELQEQLNKRDIAIERTKAELAASQVRQAQLAVEIEELERARDEWLQQLNEKLDVARIEREIAKAKDDYKRREAKLEAELLELMAAETKARSEVASVTAERDKLRAEWDSLQKELRASQDLPKEPRQPRSRQRDEFSQVLDCLLPNLEFVGDSIPFMHMEIQDRGPTLKWLYQLSIQEDVRGKDFRGAPGWLEVDKRIGDGRTSTVRIYYKMTCQPGRYYVLVSEKSEQKRDLDRLRDFK
jgi:hypothetical protein